MRSNRGKKITRAGENTYMIRLKMSRANEDNLYTMFLTWGKKNCGVDFIEKLGNGGVRYVLFHFWVRFLLGSKLFSLLNQPFLCLFQGWAENLAVEKT